MDSHASNLRIVEIPPRTRSRSKRYDRRQERRCLTSGSFILRMNNNRQSDKASRSRSRSIYNYREEHQHQLRDQQNGMQLGLGGEHEQRLRDWLRRTSPNANGRFMRGRYDDEHEQRHSTSKMCSRFGRGKLGDRERSRSRNNYHHEYRDSEHPINSSRYSIHSRTTQQASERKQFKGVEDVDSSGSRIVGQFIEAMKNLSRTSSHNLSSMSNVIPEFDPLSKTQTILSWLTKVEECAEIYQLDEREVIHYALPKLTGLAKSWYQSLPSVKYIWSEWKTNLIESFPCRENYADLLSEMLALKVKYGEPLEQYYYAKLNLLNRCEITGRNAVHCIFFGIEDRAIKLGAQAVQFRPPELVLKYLKSVKVAQNKDQLKNHNRNGYDRRLQNQEASLNK